MSLMTSTRRSAGRERGRTTALMASSHPGFQGNPAVLFPAGCHQQPRLLQGGGHLVSPGSMMPEQRKVPSRSSSWGTTGAKGDDNIRHNVGQHHLGFFCQFPEPTPGPR